VIYLDVWQTFNAMSSLNSFSLTLLFCPQQSSCNFNKNNIGASMSGTVAIQSGSESNLQAAVANVGPVSVAVDASSNAFRVRHRREN